MFRTPARCRGLWWAGALALSVFVSSNAAQATSFKTVHTFTGGSDGAQPYAGLVADTSGNFYGTTFLGGNGGSTCFSPKKGCGTVFKLASDGTETVLHAFAGGSDGFYPVAGLLLDNAGNLYGTTLGGGVGNGEPCGQFGCGIVFKLAPDGSETILHSFGSGSDGYSPWGALIADAAGNLFGTTQFGGAHNHGTVFEVTPDGTETVLYSFTGGSDGNLPHAGLVADSAGNLYGTTEGGGANGDGTVFKLAPDGAETVLHSFMGGSDGQAPVAEMIKDEAGNLYGTTYEGAGCCSGTAFKLAPDGTKTLLLAFGGSEGYEPVAPLLRDAAGNFYSITASGGTYGFGTVFKLKSNGVVNVLHAFRGRLDGGEPLAGLAADAAGNLYGTTQKRWRHGRRGTVFRIKP
jgi:uncharacterized repeat protein (TIGR03803 family)